MLYPLSYGVAEISVRPRIEASEGEIVGVSDLLARGLLRLEQLIGNAVALAIGDGLFLAVEAEPQLLLHVAGRGPAHQGLDPARLLRLEVERPQFGVGVARLHRGTRRLVDPRHHGLLARLCPDLATKIACLRKPFRNLF